MSTEQIVIGILLLVILILAYFWWSCRSTSVAIQGELGGNVDDLEVLLADVNTEHFQDTKSDSTADLAAKHQSRRNRIEEKLRKIQALRASGKIKLDARQEARLRRIVAEANDYLVNTFSGQDEESVKMIRRLRDAVLAMAVTGRRPLCDKLKKQIKSDDKVPPSNKLGYMGNILRKIAGLSDNDLNMDVNAQSAIPGILASPKSTDKKQNIDSSAPEAPPTPETPSTPPNAPPTPTPPTAERFENMPPDQKEKMELVIMYNTLNTAICSPDKSKTPLTAFRLDINHRYNDKNAPSRDGTPYETITKDQMLELADAMEPLILNVQKKLCPNGKLDRQMIYTVYQRFIATLCDDDVFLRDFMAAPLEMSLNKTVSMFQ